jgi:hypothetical protein
MVMRPEEAGLVLESLVNSIHGVKSIRDPEESDLRSLTTKKQIANGMNRSQPKLGYKIGCSPEFMGDFRFRELSKRVI